MCMQLEIKMQNTPRHICHQWNILPDIFSCARHKMITQLQKMMQSHCAEAMSVLTATTENTVGTVGTNGRHDSVRIIS